ncbi:MAG: hypothetical protein KDC79_05680 [Cyclobacteriaceae bacterium]|nr:hypothetical protein [Cyclobacteriaceae bacterium]
MTKNILLIGFLFLALTSAQAFSVSINEPLENEPLEPKIETIDQYAFLVVDLNKLNIKPEYGETVELVFSKNKRIELYNLSGKSIRYFTDSDGKLIAFITPENLRCFQDLTLKKLIFKRSGEREVVKVSLPVDSLVK